MKIGDLVRVINNYNSFYGEIGIITDVHGPYWLVRHEMFAVFIKKAIVYYYKKDLMKLF